MKGRFANHERTRACTYALTATYEADRKSDGQEVTSSTGQEIVVLGLLLLFCLSL